MSNNKTAATETDPADFIASVEHPVRKADAETLDALFRRITGWEPKMWGPSMVGYGSYHYRYESGREGDFLATGSSPRKSNLSIYIMPGYTDFQSLLENLGKHKHGKSCLYINTLADVDLGVREKLIRAGLKALKGRSTVTRT